MGRLIGDAFTKVNAVLGGGISIIVGILTARFLPSTPVPLWVFAVVVILLLWIIFALLSALRESTDEAQTLRSERGGAIVEAAIAPFSPYDGSTIVFIVKFTGASALPMGTPVIISTAEPKHERPLGTGCVRPSQQDGKSVVTLDAVNQDAAPFIAALLDQHQHDVAVAKIRIGPGWDLQNLQPRNIGSLNFDDLMQFSGDLNGVQTDPGEE